MYSNEIDQETRAQLFQLALDAGFTYAAWISPEQIPFAPELRTLCAQNSCGKYGTSWKGPPAIGPVEELMQEVLRYGHGLIIQTVGQLEDSFDYESMVEAEEVHQDHFFELVAKVKSSYPALRDNMLALTVGCCHICDSCTYPDSPCVRPDEAFASVEAYGINVNGMLTAGGLKYNNGPDTVSYVGLLLF
jgi:predicted metal-binding protein